VQQAGEHLKGGSLTGAIGTQEANHLTGSQVKGEIIHGGNFLHPAAEQGAYG
jgi:hypothetical protein